MAKPRTGLRLLRGGMVRWLPTAAELATRTPIELTARDEAILRAVALHGALTTEQLALAFFSPPGRRASPCTRLYDRLRALWLWSYLERVERPVSRAFGGRRSYLHLLGRAAPAALAARSPKAPSVACRRLDRLDPTFLEHDLTAATLWANIERLRRWGDPAVRPIRRLRWAPERELRARRVRVYDPQTGGWIPWLPDGYVEVAYDDGRVQCCLVEVDMGTLTLARFRRKVRAFEAYLASGAFAKRWGPEPVEVLVLTISWPRLQRLWLAAKEAAPTKRWDWYSFATFDALEPDRFLEPGWTTLANKHYCLLYDPVAETGADEAADGEAEQ